MVISYKKIVFIFSIIFLLFVFTNNKNPKKIISCNLSATVINIHLDNFYIKKFSDYRMLTSISTLSQQIKKNLIKPENYLTSSNFKYSKSDKFGLSTWNFELYYEVEDNKNTNNLNCVNNYFNSEIFKKNNNLLNLEVYNNLLLAFNNQKLLTSDKFETNSKLYIAENIIFEDLKKTQRFFDLENFNIKYKILGGIKSHIISLMYLYFILILILTVCFLFYKHIKKNIQKIKKMFKIISAS